MELFFKVTAGLLLLAHAFQSVSLQQSTDSPGRTIDKSWLRDLVRNRTGHQAVGIPSAGTEPDQGFDPTLDSSHDYSGGITSGSMPILNEEERIKDADEEQEDLNVVTTPELPGDPNLATQDPFLDVNVSATTLDSTNVTDVEKETKNSTATSLLSNSTMFPTAENSTRLSDINQNNSLTTLAPEGNATQETATTPTEDTRLINLTEPTDTRTTKVSQTSTTSVPATSFQPSMSSEMSLKTTISPVQDTPEVANKTGTGSSSERGLDSDVQRNKRHTQWSAILVTAIAVGCFGLVVYVILRNKRRKGFSHRKLVEVPTDPVLRLDNSGPMDFGQVAYYNRGLQGDDIQMSNIPGRY
ncbi:mucin-15 [Takifugu flavidus]|uniref:mucin-15 n=1 Tax=Takifugu flavidus TaxID=433684 RepID=UPI002544931A|nr:mucin-15 [Takifugu flavidus]XP_056881325.1 mucin-15 [Takifugu flavidus]